MSKFLRFSLAISYFLFVATIVRATDVKYCDSNEEYEVKVKGVDISPYPMARGEPATFSISANTGMSTFENKVEIIDIGHHKEEEDKKEEGQGGFLDKVKDSIHDIGEKLEGTIGFGKPTADVSAIHIPKINLERADIVVDVGKPTAAVFASSSPSSSLKQHVVTFAIFTKTPYLHFLFKKKLTNMSSSSTNNV